MIQRILNLFKPTPRLPEYDYEYANNILTISSHLEHYQYYNDHGTWRKMPGMKKLNDDDQVRINSIYSTMKKKTTTRRGG